MLHFSRNRSLNKKVRFWQYASLFIFQGVLLADLQSPVMGLEEETPAKKLTPSQKIYAKTLAGQGRFLTEKDAQSFLLTGEPKPKPIPAPARAAAAAAREEEDVKFAWALQDQEVSGAVPSAAEVAQRGDSREALSRLKIWRKEDIFRGKVLSAESIQEVFQTTMLERIGLLRAEFEKKDPDKMELSVSLEVLEKDLEESRTLRALAERPAEQKALDEKILQIESRINDLKRRFGGGKGMQQAQDFLNEAVLIPQVIMKLCEEISGTGAPEAILLIAQQNLGMDEDIFGVLLSQIESYPSSIFSHKLAGIYTFQGPTEF